MFGDENIFLPSGEENPKSLLVPAAWHGCAIVQGVLMLSATEVDGWGWVSFNKRKKGGEETIISYEEATSEVRKERITCWRQVQEHHLSDVRTCKHTHYLASV